MVNLKEMLIAHMHTAGAEIQTFPPKKNVHVPQMSSNAMDPILVLILLTPVSILKSRLLI